MYAALLPAYLSRSELLREILVIEPENQIHLFIKKKSAQTFCLSTILLAEREGFEPSVHVNAHLFSRQASSTTPAPLLKIMVPHP